MNVYMLIGKITVLYNTFLTYILFHSFSMMMVRSVSHTSHLRRNRKMAFTSCTLWHQQQGKKTTEYSLIVVQSL